MKRHSLWVVGANLLGPKRVNDEYHWRIHMLGVRYTFRFAAALLTTALLATPSWAAQRTVDCTGATPNAYKSLQAAINSLGLIGPHVISVINGSCTENVVIQDRQRLTITAVPNGAFIISAAGLDGNAMTISGSTGITLIQMGFSNGRNGLVVDRNSEVTVHGSTFSSNAASGLRVLANSTVSVDGAILNNGGNAVVAENSVLNILSSVVQNNGGAEVFFRGSRGVFGSDQVQNNSSGVVLVDGSSVIVHAPTLIQNNQSMGLAMFDGSSADFPEDVDGNGNPIASVISGNAFIGINVLSAHAQVTGALQVTNNGFSGQLGHAGIRVDDNSSFVAAGTGDISASGNSGPGIAAAAGGTMDLTGVIISNNSGDGINLQGNAQVVIFPPNTNSLSGNGGASIRCDATSVFLGDPSGLNKVECRITPFKDDAVSSTNRRMLRETLDRDVPRRTK